MKKFLSVFLITCMFLCVNVFAADDYKIVDMKEFSAVSEFSEGLCAALDVSTKRWGFVDTNKNWVIAPQFRQASWFKNGLCAVQNIDGETVLINHNGETVFKSLNNVDVDSNDFFLKKHGKYNMIFEEKNVTLVDENYKSILANDLKLCTFKNSVCLFWENTHKRIYNYKGTDVTESLVAENIYVSDNMTVSNKYIVGQADSKIKCFDINGIKVAEFDNDKNAGYALTGDMIIFGNKVYNILTRNVVFNNEEINIEEIKSYYNKYFTVKKRNGTLALYSINGELLIDFGKWDAIHPSSVSDKAIVFAGSPKGNYGIVDFSGNIVIPLEYVSDNGKVITNNGKFATFRKNGGIVYIDLATLKCHYDLSIADYGSSYQYHKYYITKDGMTVLNNNFDVVYSCKYQEWINNSFDYGIVENFWNNGIVRVHNKEQSSYSFLIFNDSGVKVKVDDTLLNFDVLPVIQNGRTLVPMRAIFEALGASVEWNGETQSITAKNKDITIQMQIGNNTITKNGQSSQIDVSPQLIGGRTMVPVRAISDCFNVLVDWNGYTQTVSLFTN